MELLKSLKEYLPTDVIEHIILPLQREVHLKHKWASKYESYEENIGFRYYSYRTYPSKLCTIFMQIGKKDEIEIEYEYFDPDYDERRYFEEDITRVYASTEWTYWEKMSRNLTDNEVCDIVEMTSSHHKAMMGLAEQDRDEEKANIIAIAKAKVNELELKIKSLEVDVALLKSIPKLYNVVSAVTGVVTQQYV